MSRVDPNKDVPGKAFDGSTINAHVQLSQAEINKRRSNPNPTYAGPTTASHLSIAEDEWVFAQMNRTQKTGRHQIGFSTFNGMGNANVLNTDVAVRSNVRCIGVAIHPVSVSPDGRIRNAYNGKIAAAMEGLVTVMHNPTDNDDVIRAGDSVMVYPPPINNPSSVYDRNNLQNGNMPRDRFIGVTKAFRGKRDALNQTMLRDSLVEYGKTGRALVPTDDVNNTTHQVFKSLLTAVRGIAASVLHEALRSGVLVVAGNGGGWTDAENDSRQKHAAKYEPPKSARDYASIEDGFSGNTTRADGLLWVLKRMGMVAQSDPNIETYVPPAVVKDRKLYASDPDTPASVREVLYQTIASSELKYRIAPRDVARGTMSKAEDSINKMQVNSMERFLQAAMSAWYEQQRMVVGKAQSDAAAGEMFDIVLHLT